MELPGQLPDVVKILQSAVKLAEFHHGFNFFGDRTFATVAKQPRLWAIQQRWNVCLVGGRINNITKADVDLHVDAR